MKSPIRHYLLTLLLLVAPVTAHAKDPFESYFIARSHLRDIIGASEWIVRYHVNDKREVTAIAFNQDATRLFHVTGTLKEKADAAGTNILLKDSYGSVEVIVSDANDELASLSLPGGKVARELMYHFTYNQLLDSFAMYSHEISMESSPFKYLKLAEEPELLRVASAAVEAAQLPELFKDRFAPAFGLILNQGEVKAVVSNLDENDPASFAGLRKGDVIVGAAINYKLIEIGSLYRRLQKPDAFFIQLFVTDDPAAKKPKHQLKQLYRCTELESKLIPPFA